MYDNTQTDVADMPSPRCIGPQTDVGDGDSARATRAPVVRAASLKAAITQLHDLTKANAGRSSRQALAANLMVLRAHGVDDDVLGLVVEMVLAQNVDEEMAAALNYLASGFLLALLTLREEGALCDCKTVPMRASCPRLGSRGTGHRRRACRVAGR